MKATLEPCMDVFTPYVSQCTCVRVHQCVCLPTFDKEASGEGEMEGKVVIY